MTITLYSDSPKKLVKRHAFIGSSSKLIPVEDTYIKGAFIQTDEYFFPFSINLNEYDTCSPMDNADKFLLINRKISK
jgi:hypothetical protein